MKGYSSKPASELRPPPRDVPSRDLLTAAHRDLHDFALIVDDLRRAIGDASVAMPSGRSSRRAHRILSDAMTRSTVALHRIRARPAYPGEFTEEET